MLDYLGERHGDARATEAGATIRAAVDRAYGEGLVRTFDVGGRDGTMAAAATIAGLCSNAGQGTAAG